MKKYFMIALMLMTFFVRMSYAAGSFSVGSGTSLYGSVMLGASAGGECAGYLICQNFEGTGYDNGETWTESIPPTGTVDEDFTTTPLRGSDSLQVMLTSDQPSAYAQTPTGIGLTDAYFFFRWQYAVARDVGTPTVIRLVDSGGTTIARVTCDNGGGLSVYQGTSSTYAAGLNSLDNTYFVWGQYQAGSGTGVLRLWISTTTTKPGSVSVEVTNGDSTATLDAIRFLGSFNTGGGYQKYDQILVDDAVIGDVSS